MQHNDTSSKESFVSHCQRAWTYSLSGLVYAFRGEIAFRMVLCETVFFFPLALFLARSWCECVVLVLPTVLSVITELLNSAIEKTVDRISLDQHELSKKAKDMGSAAQFICQCFLAFVWISYVFERYASS